MSGPYVSASDKEAFVRDFLEAMRVWAKGNTGPTYSLAAMVTYAKGKFPFVFPSDEEAARWVLTFCMFEDIMLVDCPKYMEHRLMRGATVYRPAPMDPPSGGASASQPHV
jgi:hypothetical protein